MTNSVGEIGQTSDPEGSIFLRRSQSEIDSLEFALLLNRGIATDMSFEEKQELYEELQEDRLRLLGGKAIETV